MNKIRQRVFEAIEAERNYQDQKWGPDHDDLHLDWEWDALIAQRLFRVPAPGQIRVDRDRMLVQVAALAVAALESRARQPR